MMTERVFVGCAGSVRQREALISQFNKSSGRRRCLWVSCTFRALGWSGGPPSSQGRHEGELCGRGGYSDSGVHKNVSFRTSPLTPHVRIHARRPKPREVHHQEKGGSRFR